MLAIEPSNPISLWAKASGAQRHPLLCHMLDVAALADQMWRSVVSPAARRWFAEGLGLDEAATAQWIAIWAGLHDLGKAAPAFQRQQEHPRYQELNRSYPHGVITANALAELFPQPPFNLARDIAEPLAVVIGGHHGVFPRSDERIKVSHEAIGTQPWANVRALLAKQLADVIGVPPSLAKLDNARLLWLAGLIAVADWIGSDERHFPYADTSAGLAFDPAEYWHQAQQRAAKALATLGWTAWARPEPLPFSTLFPSAVPPFPVQQAVIDLAETLDGSALIIVEAPMGEGKTEAAFYLADRASVVHGLPGHYIGLPTRATSNQMYHRLRTFLLSRYPEQAINLQLLHGQAALVETDQALDRLPQPHAIAGSDSWDGAPASVVAAEWFTQRKRGLLAPFGVGTVDQALLAVLQTRHVFVRLFGLAHKTVVIDEVHAYDTYMSTLLERLLTWLAALGCRVVLLSATLPRQRRERLVAAYAEGLALLSHGDAPVPADSTIPSPYPRLTWTTRHEIRTRSVGISAQRRNVMNVRWLTGITRDALGQLLREALAHGGCAAVICNTVRSAQETYRALQPYFAGKASDGGPVLDLLHARFLVRDREEREQRALARFGKGGTRPDRAVLVATQIIEQSLDLDFDLMVTELAPADLVLQRAGRLHRHARQRPPGLEQPTLWILAPAEQDGVPVFDPGTTHVYDEHLLLRTWWELRDRATIRLPDDIEALVEAVYDDNQPCPPEAGERLIQHWEKTKQDLHRKQLHHERMAKDLRLLPPTYQAEELLEDLNRELEEDDPSVHPSIQALTRISDPSTSCICLMPAQWQNLDRDRIPTRGEAKELIGCSVEVTDSRVVFDLLNLKTPSGWRKSSLLRNHRLLCLAEDRSVDIGNYHLSIDQEIGLVISRKEQ